MFPKKINLVLIGLIKIQLAKNKAKNLIDKSNRSKYFISMTKFVTFTRNEMGA